DGTVAIDELVVGVEIALGSAGVDRCTAVDGDGDGQVAIQELITAVGAALTGCAGPTPTTTVGPLHCGDGTADADEECDDGNTVAGDGCDAACQLEPGGNPCAGVPSFPGVPATTELVTDGLALPVFAGAPRLDPHRLFVVEQAGTIRVVKDGALLDAPFLDIHDRVGCCGERGLLSIAFHPDYERNGRFFVDYTNTAGDTVIARYTVGSDPDRADRDSEQILLTIAQPFANHNGGLVAFAPDGTLFVGMGDGGSQHDPNGNGQNDQTLLAKMLRLDVDVEDAPFYRVPPDNPRAGEGAPLGLIWAKGVRNPWRYAFDRLTGDLYIADVGQDRREEIDFLPAGSPGGSNFGWNIFEGNICHEPPQGCPDQVPPFTPPILDYTHRDGCSITGGYVYRGCALPDLRGQYFFSDYCTPFIRSFALQNGVVTGLQDRTAALAPGGGFTIDSVTSFGEDARGELYIVDYGGELYRVVPKM
ncbi:MAG TPA: PQQ-dependent sugar dehydrogenase, partial [Candidatus Dormibacteraeota bacterium]|nr:PQQ-dependent sugar dehydrogenase [Candidatus Dormibacteraeota bacterium]